MNFNFQNINLKMINFLFLNMPSKHKYMSKYINLTFKNVNLKLYVHRYESFRCFPRITTKNFYCANWANTENTVNSDCWEEILEDSNKFNHKPQSDFHFVQ